MTDAGAIGSVMPFPAPNALAVANVRLHANAERLVSAVNTLDRLLVPAIAADYLDALYGLTRLWRDEFLGSSVYDPFCAESADGRVVEGLTYLRGQGIHRAVVLSKLGGVADYYYDHYNCWTWIADAPLTGMKVSGSYQQHFADREVRITMDSAERFCMALPQAGREVA